jgi:lipoprotein-anchoring transpeptidase ErfK/SrfK
MSVRDLLPDLPAAPPGPDPAASPDAPPAAPATPPVVRPPISRGGYAVRRRRLPCKLLGLGAGCLLALALALAAAWAGGFSYRPLAEVPLAVPRAGRPDASPGKLAGRLAAQAPAGVYVVVDTIANRLYLKRGGEVVREAVCSTGTGGLLVDPASGRRWVFDTPLGVHRVLEKKEDPVWVKPDWAFVEEGLPIPRNPAERVDPNSLGDFALSLGDGYLIHGTLYQRLLGRSVTHGCVRLGDDDLAAVYRAVPVGTRVYIY